MTKEEKFKMLVSDLEEMRTTGKNVAVRSGYYLEEWREHFKHYEVSPLNGGHYMYKDVVYKMEGDMYKDVVYKMEGEWYGYFTNMRTVDEQIIINNQLIEKLNEGLRLLKGEKMAGLPQGGSNGI